MSLFDPSPQSDCPQCFGHGYHTQHYKGSAKAIMCTCMGVCTRCEGGVLRKLVDGVWRSGRCRCQKLPDRIQMFNRSGIPARHGEKSIGNFKYLHRDHIKVVTRITMWLDAFAAGSREQGIVLHGGVGRGKTHLMVGLCKMLMFDHGIPVRFIEFSRLLGQLREGYSAGKSDDMILAPLIEVPVLAIDELGKGRLSEWEISIIDDIISRRYNAMKPILGTTNYDWREPSGKPTPTLMKQEFEQTLGDRIGGRAFSRLQEITMPFLLAGSDFRTLNEADIPILEQQASGIFPTRR